LIPFQTWNTRGRRVSPVEWSLMHSFYFSELSIRIKFQSVFSHSGIIWPKLTGQFSVSSFALCRKPSADKKHLLRTIEICARSDEMWEIVAVVIDGMFEMSLMFVWRKSTKKALQQVEKENVGERKVFLNIHRFSSYVRQLQEVKNPILSMLICLFRLPLRDVHT
jgi:hypothetical protein